MPALVDLSGLNPKDVRESVPEAGCVIPYNIDGSGERALVVKVDVLPSGARRTTFDRQMFGGKMAYDWSFEVMNWSKEIVDRYLGMTSSGASGASLTTTPASRKVPDWPLTCPKCHRPQSAVLLFNFYDCKHGCFGRKAPGSGEHWDFDLGGKRWRATLTKEVNACLAWYVSEQSFASDENLAAFKADPQAFAVQNWDGCTRPGWWATSEEERTKPEEWYLRFEEVP